MVLPLVLLIGATLGLAMGCVIHFFEIQPFCRDARRDVSRPGTVPPDQRFLDPDHNGFWTEMAQQRLRFGGFFISISVVIALVVVLSQLMCWRTRGWVGMFTLLVTTTSQRC